MCTVALLLGRFEEAPLVFAANRDERLDRPAEGPALRPGSVNLVAPRDRLAGGTWWAVAPGGLVVAITNRFGVPVDPDRHSRGTLVDTVARRGGFEPAVAFAASLRATDWNGFHLVVAQGDRAWVMVGDGARTEAHDVSSGLLIVSERSFGAHETSRDDSVRVSIERQVEGDTGPDVTGLLQVLSGHGEGFEGPCIHAPALGYGTRSSAIIVPQGRWRRLLHTEGPPCVSPPADLTGLLDGLEAP